jgi:hypothetical protein
MVGYTTWYSRQEVNYCINIIKSQVCLIKVFISGLQLSALVDKGYPWIFFLAQSPLGTPNTAPVIGLVVTAVSHVVTWLIASITFRRSGTRLLFFLLPLLVLRFSY